MGPCVSKMVKENPYNHGKIYRIVSEQTNDVYIGSTCNSLSRRIYQHKYHYKQWLNKERPQLSSFEIVQYDDCQIILIEDVCCENKNQLFARERFFIESMNCCNRSIPNRTQKEYREDNREKFYIYKKEWRSNNREQINQKNREYEQKNKEIIAKRKSVKYTCNCGSITQIGSKSKHERTTKHILFIQNL
jgi:hypothetical protein